MDYNEYSKLPGLTSSALKDYATEGSVFFLFNVFSLLEKRTTAEMEFGTALHDYMESSSTFLDKYAVVAGNTPASKNEENFCFTFIDKLKKVTNNLALEPTEEQINIIIYQSYTENYSTKGQPATKIATSAVEKYNNLKGYIEFLIESENKKPITSEELTLIQNMKKNYSQIEEALIDESISVFGQYEETLDEIPVLGEINDVPVKCKPDRLLIFENAVVIIDYKTHTGNLTKARSKVKFDYNFATFIYTSLIQSKYPDKEVVMLYVFLRKETFNLTYKNSYPLLSTYLVRAGEVNIQNMFTLLDEAGQLYLTYKDNIPLLKDSVPELVVNSLNETASINGLNLNPDYLL